VQGSRADAVACLGIVLGAILVCWPLLAHLDGVPPDDNDLDLDLMTYYGYAGAARTTMLRFGQFPFRSPWHGGGYPLLAYPDDLTLTPTMLLVLAVGPWAAIKIDFVLTTMAAGLGMFLLTRRRLRYSVVAGLFSATAFAFGGFLMARWLRGWRVPTHAVWLPLILYALWRGRCWRTATPAVPISPDKSLAKRRRQHQQANPCEGRWRTARLAVPNSADSPLSRLRRQHQQANPCEGRWWLALAAVLVAWLLIDHKYVAITMGWFLLMVGLLRPDEEAPEKVPAWGYFGRLTVVWLFAAGLAAVKLMPMAPLLFEHLRMAGGPKGPLQAGTIALWLVIFAALGVTTVLGRLVRARRTRGAGLAGIALTLAAVVVAVVLWAPPSRPVADLGVHLPARAGWFGRLAERALRAAGQSDAQPSRLKWVVHAADCAVNFGDWRQNVSGEWTPTASDRYRHRSPVGPIVCVLAVVAVILRPRRTWKWAILAGLFLAFELGPATPRELGESVRRLPLLSWIRRPREQLNFYLFFLLTLLAGRALDWRGAEKVSGTFCAKHPSGRSGKRYLTPFPLWPIAAWAILAVNVLWVGADAHGRLAHTVSAALPPAPAWAPYELLHHVDARRRPINRWRDQPAFLLRQNMGLQFWDCDFRDSRRYARRGLVPSRLVAPDGSYRPNPAFRGMAWFDEPENEVADWKFTPNAITVRVNVRTPGVLVINQIGDADWRPSEGVLAHGHAGGSSLARQFPRKAASPAPASEPLQGVLAHGDAGGTALSRQDPLTAASPASANEPLRGALVSDDPLLKVRLSRLGTYDVRLRYVPKLFYRGLAVTVIAALGGVVLLVLGSRGKGVRYLLPERPEGCFAQKVPDTFSADMREDTG